ncbi:MAG: SDR family NAD(P)-dependent oxidoreductase [Pseudomonadota bacterium]
MTISEEKNVGVFRDDVLAGKVALITGGGSGINLGIATSFVAYGARVSLVSRTQEKLDAAAAQLSPDGATAKGFSADVRDADALGEAVAKTVDAFGGIDILVNGAAGNFLAPASKLSSKAFQTVMDIDTLGTFNASNLCYEHLKASKGVILNVSAPQASMPTPLQVHAGAAKAAIEKMTQDLALEWGPDGIRVVGLTPGGVEDTEGVKRLLPPGLVEKVHATLPLGRLATAREMGEIATFLVSEAAGYISGTTLMAEGASSMPLSGTFWNELPRGG